MEKLVDYHWTQLNPTEHLIEMAARRHHDSQLWPMQFTWDQHVQLNDHRVAGERTAMMKALKEILVIPADWQPEHWTPIEPQKVG